MQTKFPLVRFAGKAGYRGRDCGVIFVRQDFTCALIHPETPQLTRRLPRHTPATPLSAAQKKDWSRVTATPAGIRSQSGTDGARSAIPCARRRLPIVPDEPGSRPYVAPAATAGAKEGKGTPLLAARHKSMSAQKLPFSECTWMERIRRPISPERICCPEK